MSRPLLDLQQVLGLMVSEHRTLLTLVEAQHAAMKKLDIVAMIENTSRQEASRLRLISLEHRRQAVSRQIAAAAKLNEELSISRIMELFPPYAAAFGKLRGELRDVMTRISKRASMASRLSGAVLGHLNTALRLLAAAVERAGLYTKDGTPRVSSRLGTMDAVG